jgi:triacylglycerol lipase
MKRLVLLMTGLLGCTGSTALAPGVDGGAGDLAERAPTQWPTGSVDRDGGHPEYPLILAHGMSGFMNIGPLNYFYGVADALRKDGHPVFVSVVDAFNSSEVRGAQLQTFVEGVLQQTGAPKVKMICHSQGGFDCRYVANQMGDKVAAIVTLATPHLGTPVADVAFKALPGPVQTAMSLLINLFGEIIDGGMASQNSQAAMDLVSSAGAADFNRRFPDDPRVAYYSIAGRSNGSHGEDACGGPDLAPFVTRWDPWVDQTELEFAATATILADSFSPEPTNDGLVTVTSAKWGTFLGCIPADHLQEVCQLAGAPPGGGNAFDCITFYRQLADWLVAHDY